MSRPAAAAEFKCAHPMPLQRTWFPQMVTWAFVTLSGGFLAGAAEDGPAWTVPKFTSHPSVVHELVYEWRVVERPDLSPEAHLVRWQMNGYFHRQGSSVAALHQPLEAGATDWLCGSYGGECWTAAPMSTNKYTLMVGVTGPDGTNPQWDSIRPHLEISAYLLNLGLRVPAVGGLAWEGNQFTETGGSGPFEASGELFLRDGKADRAEVTLKRRRGGGPDLRQRVNYGYGEGEVPPGLPSRVELRGLDAKGAVQFTEVYQIHRLRLSETPLAEEAFSAAPFLVNVPFVEGRREAGKPTKARVPGGPWQRVYPANPENSGVRQASVWALWGLLICCSTGFAVAFVAIFRRTQHNQEALSKPSSRGR